MQNLLAGSTGIPAMDVTIVSLIVQGGFAALCGYMVYTREKIAKRTEDRRITDRQDMLDNFAKKNSYIRTMLLKTQELLERSIQAQERSTEVCRKVIEVISKNNNK